jgi:hypothetical protein
VKKRIAPSRVRYIKLGERGRWEKSCLERGINRIGFGTAQPGRFRLCQTSKWSDLAKSFFAEGKDARTANRFANEVRIFFEDDGSILWVTFVGERFHWGFADPTKPSQSSDLDGVYRPIRGGWQSTDLLGESLTKDRLSGALTKLAAYRSCLHGQLALSRASCRTPFDHPLSLRVEVGESAINDQPDDDQVSPAAAL